MMSRYLIFTLYVFTAWAFGADFSNDWKQVQLAVNNQQAKTAVSLLKPLETKAFEKQAWDDGLKAMLIRARIENGLGYSGTVFELDAFDLANEGNGIPPTVDPDPFATPPPPEEDGYEGGLTGCVQQLEKEIPAAPEAVRPLLRWFQARMLLAYATDDERAIQEREKVPQRADDPITRWNAERINAAIEKSFQQALDDPSLRTTPVAQFRNVLSDAGAYGDSIRPTLYDLIAHSYVESLTALRIDQNHWSEPSNYLLASMPVFDRTEDFLAWQPAAQDPQPWEHRVIKVYQELMEFHRADQDRSAWLHCDLERLRWAGHYAAGNDKEQRLLAAMQRFIKENDSHPLSADARQEEYLILIMAERYEEAMASVKTGVAAFPQHPSGKVCQALMEDLEAPYFNYETVETWTSNGDEIEVDHRNLKRLWFRLYRQDWKPTLKDGNMPSLDHNHELVEQLMQKSPDIQWDAALNETKPYHTGQTTIKTPSNIPFGTYLLIISDQKDYSEKALLEHAPFRVSNLRLVNSEMVVDAETGAPKSNVTVEILRDNPNEKRVVQTDENGMFPQPKIEKNRSLLVIAREGENFTYDYQPSGSSWYGVNSHKTESVTFFTDRSIYRPGQTIQFKGILTHADQEKANYHTIADRELTIVFTGPNELKIGELKCTTNDMGSFSGTFVAPTQSLTGSFTLSVENLGSEYISIEEYKRPQFEVEINPLAKAIVVGDRVTISGFAKTYTGVPIGNAKVVWRGERSMYFSGLGDWYGWNHDSFSGESLSEGETVTAADGSFRFEVTADADLRIPADKEPIFSYYFDIDVTDRGGESQTIDLEFGASYAEFIAEMKVDEWQEVGKPIIASIHTKTPNSLPFPATGTLRVYSLIQPTVCPRRDMEGAREFSPHDTDLSGPRGWEKGALVRELPVATKIVDGECIADIPVDLPAGCYRMEFEAFDAKQQKVAALSIVKVIDPQSSAFAVKTPFHVATPSLTRNVGDTIEVVWGSGYEAARAVIEWTRDGELLKREWSTPGRTQQVFNYVPNELARGGIRVRVSQYSRNRVHQWYAEMEIPFTDKDFIVEWEKISPLLRPGDRDTWVATISRKDGKPVTAEMVATLYDASLDDLSSHSFADLRNELRANYVESEYESYYHDSFSASAYPSEGQLSPSIENPYRVPQEELDDAPSIDEIHVWGVSRVIKYPRLSFTTFEADMIDYYEPPELPNSVGSSVSRGIFPVTPATPTSPAYGGNLPKAISQIVSRRKLDETAFFYPHLRAEKDGKIRMSFTIPEGLGRWKFLGFAHDTTLRSGSIEGETITAKDLMVQPNPPRFLREGDELDFTVRVSNLSDKEQSGIAHFTLADAEGKKDKTAMLGVSNIEQEFLIPAKESRTLSWRLRVPDDCGHLLYTIRATSGVHSDGEEGWLPVLPRRILVNDALSLSMRNATEIKRDFPSLRASANSDTLRHESLRVQVVSRPVWYAVMALPYLMEFPHECAEQTFSRYYANAMAHQLLKSDPQIRRVFDQWRSSKTLDSPLEKNQELAGILLEETPWLRDADDDATRRKRVALLFDENRIQQESTQVIKKLTDMQQSSGMWPWFPEGDGSPFITAHIVAGFGELRAAGVEVNMEPVMNAVRAMDEFLVDYHQEILREETTHPGTLGKHQLNSLIIHFLYSRSFFLSDRKIDEATQPAYDYFLQQTKLHWNKLDSRLTTAQVALVLWRNGEKDTAKLITRAFRETAVRKKEIGMYWPTVVGTGWWWNAPVESQAHMIAAFAEIDQDTTTINDCRDWLIQQRRNGDWGTTTATTAAVRALLTGAGSENVLADDELAHVDLAGKELVAQDVEAGTGFYECRIPKNAIKAEMADLTMRKKTPGVAWASVHWSYFEDVAKVAQHSAGGLQLEKQLLVKRSTAKGTTETVVAGPLQPGDEIITRLIITTNRDLEFLHLKDQRGSGTEPITVHSGRRWFDSFNCYESTRDSATHFYIDSLSKGIHVIDYTTRVQHAGSYQSGIATLTCMYAPEFQARSASVRIEVKPMEEK